MSTPNGKAPAKPRKPRVPRTALTDAQLGIVIFAVYILGLVFGGLTEHAGLSPIAQLVIFGVGAMAARVVVARLTRRLRRTR